MEYRLEKATPNDVASVFSLVEARIHWMDVMGIKQWNTTGYLEVYPLDYYVEQQEQGNLYVLYTKDNDIVSAVVLLNDDDRWNDRAETSAFYVHNLVSDVAKHGAGSILLQEVEKIAKQYGKEYIRLDCAVNNTFLNRYYEKRGYMLAGSCIDGMYVGNRREKKLPK